MDCVVPLQRENSNEMNIEMRCLSPVILIPCSLWLPVRRRAQDWQQPLYLFNCKPSILKITPSWYVEMSQLISVKARMSICFNGQLIKALWYFRAISNLKHWEFEESIRCVREEARVLQAALIGPRVASLPLLGIILQEEYCCLFMSCSLYCFPFLS